MSQAALICVLVLGSALDQAPGPHPKTPYVELLQFLWGMYPALRDYAAEIQLQPVRDGQQVVIKDASGRKTPSEIMESPRLVEATVFLGKDGWPERLQAKGPFLAAVKNAQLAEAVAAAVKEGRSPDDSILRAQPAFGPGMGSQLAGHIAEELNRTFGPTILESVDSQIVTSGEYGFLWTVRITTRTAQGTERSYVLLFEPFEGRLVSLTLRR